ncbi:MAG: paraquat-inducible protein A [Pseudomonadota bacterium]
MPTARRATPLWEVRLLQGTLLLATALLALGVFSPLLTVKKMVLWKNTLSVIGTLEALWGEGQYMLLTVIAVFSLVLPLVKLGVLYRVVFWPPRTAGVTRTWLTAMHNVGRWAMLDVLVVAVLLVALKLGALASVQLHDGLYLFTAAVILIAAITHRVATHPPTPSRKRTTKRRTRTRR